MAQKEKKAPSKRQRTRAAPIPRPRDNGALPPDHPESDFLVVGIGASAGGLEAIEQFFSRLPSKPGMAFVIVPHLEPKRQTFMPELVAKMTSMPVRTAEHGMAVRPNEVYVIPPDNEMTILDRRLQLVKRSERSPHDPINHFLRSLAGDVRDRSVGVVLSGMGSDGTAGLREIRGQLGLTIAQDPATAKYDSMPRSVIASGTVDMVVPPDQIPEALTEYSRRILGGRQVERHVPGEEGDGDDLQSVLLKVRAVTGHDFSGYKRTTLLRRIERRVQALHLETMETYARFLSESPGEVNSLFREILIGVTGFFRDPEAFDIIKERVLPMLLPDRPSEHPIRIWVVGCSTGEEAYSLAILLREFMDQTRKDFAVQIFASDIDPIAIETARSGVYPSTIATDVSEERLRKFFTQDNGSFRIRRDLREMLVFAVQDIVKDPPFTKIDLISCRNLLIYLNSDLQRQVLPLFHYSLRPKGILFLGSSETIGAHPHLFSPLDKKWKIFVRLESAVSPRPVDFPFSRTHGHAQRAEQKRAQEPNLPQILERVLLAEYAPPAVVVNEKGDIVYIHGRTGDYLEPAPGRASLNVMEMAREGLRLQLPVALRNAVLHKQTVVSKRIRVKSNGGFRSVDIEVRPVEEPSSMHGLLLVLFTESSEPEAAGPAGTRKGKAVPGEDESRIRDLERELGQTKESLQSTIEELESANEELKSTNEEYQSTNEELQSANEELETSKEELQSLNEELITVNSELQGKFDELTRTNTDMKNFLDSLEVPTVFLDNELRVKRFTSQMPNLINLIETDVGRPISHIVTKLRYERLVNDAQSVVRSARYIETEVQSKDDRWYLMRILPYKTAANVIDGVVITFMDMTKKRVDADQMAQLRGEYNFCRSVLDTFREPYLVLDSSLKVISASESFFRFFHMSNDTVIGKYLYDLGDRQWDIHEFRELLERILPNRETIEGYQIEREFTRLGLKRLSLNARRLQAEGEQRILLVFADVTGS